MKNLITFPDKHLFFGVILCHLCNSFLYMHLDKITFWLQKIRKKSYVGTLLKMKLLKMSSLFQLTFLLTQIIKMSWDTWFLCFTKFHCIYQKLVKITKNYVYVIFVNFCNFLRKVKKIKIIKIMKFQVFNISDFRDMKLIVPPSKYDIALFYQRCVTQSSLPWFTNCHTIYHRLVKITK